MERERPNILLITTDQQRFDGMSLNGNRFVRTPNMDHLATRGVNFTRGYVTCPSCIAARRTILTGLHCSRPEHGLPGYQDGMEWDPPWTLPGLLGEAGYQTQLIGKFHMFPQRKRYGFDHMILAEQPENRSASPYFKENDYALWLQEQIGLGANAGENGIGANSWVARPFQLHENLHHTSFVAQQAVEFINRRRDPSCPFFLHMSFHAPHPPLTPPQVYWDRYVGQQGWQPHIGSWAPQSRTGRPGLATDAWRGPFDPAAMHDAMAGYYGLINHIDDRLGFVLSQVFQRGCERANMPLWVIFTSDHGEMLGDHQLYRKILPYEASAHVPFFVAQFNAKGVPIKSRPCDALVGLEDLLPTICELAGARTPEGLDGRSLVPLLTGQADGVRDQMHGEHSGYAGNHFVVAGPYKYCWFTETNEEQLFNLANDPWELQDLSADEPAVLEEMRDRLAARLAGRTDFTYDRATLRPAGNRPPEALFG